MCVCGVSGVYDVSVYGVWVVCLFPSPCSHTDAAVSCLPTSVCIRTILSESPCVHPQPCRPAAREQGSLCPCSPRPLTHHPVGRLTHHLCLPRSTPSMHLVAQSCLTSGNPIDCSPPGSSVHGILQARTLEWVAISSSKDLPDPGIEPTFPAFQADSWPTEPCSAEMLSLFWVMLCSFNMLCNEHCTRESALGQAPEDLKALLTRRFLLRSLHDVLGARWPQLTSLRLCPDTEQGRPSVASARRPILEIKPTGTAL